MSRDLPDLLLSEPTNAMDQTEIQSRLQFARQQSLSWKEIASEIEKLLRTPQMFDRAASVLENSIALCERTMPDEFFPNVWNGLVNRLYNGSNYQPDAIPSLQLLLPSPNHLSDQVSEARQTLRERLIQAMTAGHDSARASYESFHFEKSETEQDIEAAVSLIRSGVVNSSSLPLIKFIIAKPPPRLRSAIINQLEILATDASNWDLGLTGLADLQWFPGIQIAARVIRSLAQDAMLHRESDPARAAKALDVAFHLAPFAKHILPRDYLERTIEALRQSDVINTDAFDDYKRRLEARNSQPQE